MIGGRPGLATGLLIVAFGCSDDSTAPQEARIPTSVVVSTSSVRFSSLGETAQLTAAVHDQDGQPMAGATVAWVSANTSVATVDGNGLVESAGQGATNIVVTAGSTASASVGVMVEQVPHTVVLSEPPDSLAVGDSIQLTAQAFDALGSAIADVTFEWSSSDTAIVTVDQRGWVRAMAGGSAEITASAGTTASAVAEITAVQVPHTVVLSEPPDSLAVGDSIQFTAQAFDALGSAIADVTFEWSSSDTAIVTVDQRGWVRAMAGGSAEITAAAGTTASAVAGITAVQVPHTVVFSEPPDSLAVGDSIQLTAQAFDALGSAIADVSFEWSSSDTAIATVDQRGWVRALAGGSAEITASAGTTASAVAEITAVQVPHTVVLSEPPDSLAVGDSIQFTAQAFRRPRQCHLGRHLPVVIERHNDRGCYPGRVGGRQVCGFGRDYREGGGPQRVQVPGHLSGPGQPR